MGVIPLSHCKDQVGHDILKRQETTVDPNLSKPNAPSALKGKNLSTKDFYDGPFALVGMGNSPNKLESMTVNHHWRKNLTVTRRGKRRLLPRDDQKHGRELETNGLAPSAQSRDAVLVRCSYLSWCHQAFRKMPIIIVC
ncbi:hypothetical protein DM01DRAFT_1024687 [Hesseltinella vesiculosa]|uniref:Uncharacterized protein n=1 Tax=Hesseltinella vesiculosa TaxID=101127 RepID=A0A1X2GK78_9FUNG|nr:hypothetical protein DM01DRAFT_1024687 [Hesseltinella vesiculosa]